MKTKEVLNKYRKILSNILNCESSDIKFFITERGDTPEDKKIKDEIGELNYIKDNNWSLGKYLVYCKEYRVAEFKLYELPHCCAYMVSCNSIVFHDYRNKSIGTILNNLRQEIARLLGYSAVLCTDVERNIYQRKLLATNGWKDIHSIVNKRTNNRIYLSVVNI